MENNNVFVSFCWFQGWGFFQNSWHAKVAVVQLSHFEIRNMEYTRFVESHTKAVLFSIQTCRHNRCCHTEKYQ